MLRPVDILERTLGVATIKHLTDMQPGDVTATHADVEEWSTDFGCTASTLIEVGVERFVSWHRENSRV